MDDLIKKIGTGEDLLALDVSADGQKIDATLRSDESKADAEERIHEDYEDSRDQEYDRTSGETESGEESFNGNWDPNKSEQNKRIYDKYSASDEFLTIQLRRIGNALERHSNVNQVDMIKTARNIQRISQAAGVEVAVKYIALSNRLKEDTSVLTSNKLATEHIRELNDFRDAINEDILAITDTDISKLSADKLKKLINSGHFDGKANALAKASLDIKTDLEQITDFRKALKKQQVSVEGIVDRAMGDDVAIWDGYQYSVRTYRSIKKIAKTIKRLKNKLSKPSGNYNVYEKNTPKSTGSSQTLSSNNVQKANSPKPTSQPTAKQPTLENKTTKKNVFSNLFKNNASTATKASGTAASSVAAGSVGSGAAAGAAGSGAGAAAGSSAGAAAGGAGATAGSAGIIAGIVIAIIALLLVLVMLLLMTITSAFHGDKDLSAEKTPDGEGASSMMYQAYLVLKAHDEDILQQINEGFEPKAVRKSATNNTIYTDYTVDDLVTMLTGQKEIDIEPAKDENGNSLCQSYNGYGVPVSLLRSNARDILCAGTVLVENNAESAPQTFKRYIESLWYDTHEIGVEFICNSDGSLYLEPCDGSCSETCWEEIETREVVVMTLDPETGKYIPATYTDAVTGEQKTLTKTEYVYYLCGDGFREEMTDGFMDSIQALVDEGKLWSWTSYNDEEAEWEWRFCPGHAKYRVSVTTAYLNDNDAQPLQSSLFSADKFTYDPKNADFWNTGENSNFIGSVKSFFKSLDVMGITCTFTKLDKNTTWDGERFQTFEAAAPKRIWADIVGLVLGADEDEQEMLVQSKEYINWNGWTDNNREWAIQLYDADWYDLYGINFSETGMGGNSLDDSKINELVGEIDNQAKSDMIRFALGMSGKIPYYWGGKQNVTVKYADHSNMSVAAFLATYYPHLGTQQVTISNGAPASVGGWYGCGGIDGKRNVIGLDCSGFVCFVYNNFGISLSGGTGDLKRSGIAVGFDDLESGDLLINDPVNAHVVMFVKWDNDERTEYTTVESAGSSGVIVKSGVTKRWDYYRRIVP